MYKYCIVSNVNIMYNELSVGNIVFLVCEPCSVGEEWVMAKAMG